ncbi:hypothetical protein DFH09DRAFT_1309007 [Mycena vulgaris]|nr:hypothetical protein DFH09DRAFT_1309007 [Mycena vulgaris]
MSSSLMDSLLPPLPRNPPTTVTPVHPASVLAPHPPRTARRPAHTVTESPHRTPATAARPVLLPRASCQQARGGDQATPSRPRRSPHARCPVQVGRHSRQDKGRENEELRERIKTLEKSWDAVMKALAAQGMATGTVPAAPAAADPLAPASASASSPLPQPTADAPASPPFSALDPTMPFPISPAPSHTP